MECIYINAMMVSTIFTDNWLICYELLLSSAAAVYVVIILLQIAMATTNQTGQYKKSQYYVKTGPPCTK